MRFAKWSFLIVTLLAVGCSSTGGRKSSEIRADNREEYAKVVDRRLDDWEKEASRMSGDRGQSMMALVRDTRAEVRAMEAAPAGTWTEYKGRIDDRLDRIENLSEATAE